MPTSRQVALAACLTANFSMHGGRQPPCGAPASTPPTSWPSQTDGPSSASAPSQLCAGIRSYSVWADPVGSGRTIFQSGLTYSVVGSQARVERSSASGCALPVD